MIKSERSGIGRRTFLKGTAGATAAMLLPGRVWAQPSTTPTIPEVTVRMGGFAVTNHAWPILAVRSGFLNDVGITMANGAPKFLLEPQVIPQLLNGEIDISTITWGLVVQTLDKLPNVHPILSYSYYQGNTILGSPNKGYKSVDEFIDEGMSWEEAASAAVQQLRDKPYAIPASPSTYPWNDFIFSLGGMQMNDANTIPVEDPRAVQLAINDQVDFAAPGGAIQMYQLQYQAGWKPIIGTQQVIKYMPAGSAVYNLLNYDVLQATSEYIENNHDTVLRFTGAMFRTMDYMFGPNQMQALAEYAPFINANSGAELDAESIKYIFEVIDPFFRWEDQASVYEDPTYPLYYRSLWDYQVNRFIESGAIEDKPYDLDEMFASKSIWLELRELKAAAEANIARLTSGGSISPERQVLLDEATRHLENFNFLDAARFAEAAVA